MEDNMRGGNTKNLELKIFKIFIVIDGYLKKIVKILNFFR